MATADRLRFLERDTPAWDSAWSTLAGLHGGDPVCEDPETGEVWHYIGSTLRRGAHVWEHHFRHRHFRGRRVEQLVFRNDGLPADWLADLELLVDAAAADDEGDA